MTIVDSVSEIKAMLNVLAQKKEWLEPYQATNVLFGDVVALVKIEGWDEYLPIQKKDNRPIIRGVVIFQNVIQFGSKRVALETVKGFEKIVDIKIVGVANYFRDEYAKLTELERFFNSGINLKEVI